MNDTFVMQRLQELADSKTAEIFVCSYPWASSGFTCQITGKAEGVELKVSSNAPSAIEAISDAIGKYYRITGKGAPELQAKVLEYKPLEPAVIDNDDIPF